ncbi:hypothetical protein SAY87_023126 [Trapa incisa]|uniref:C2H2-type domain-containing protein n=1 Tax=Trapa incisa TaxID=236973 RepID=A0AAN7QAD8_9MYRT|nr:hypothetical protein SAY87_023126 [Trapa incisa]
MMYLLTMELAQQQCHMLMKRRELIIRPSQLYNGFSWERAFADDTSGVLGGFAWPPRSYSCSFCGREFRSAQALGGHMNVHRRDRARLRQSLITTTTDSTPPAVLNNEVQALQISTVGSRVSSALSSNSMENGDGSGHFVAFMSHSSIAPEGSNEETIVSHRDQGRAYADAEIMSFKRAKTTAASSSPISLFFEASSTDHSCSLRLSTGLEVGHVEDHQLDLELRLGDPPKVK